MPLPGDRKPKDLFAEALALPREAREAFLARTCRGDEALRAELDALLAAHEGAPEFLKEPTIPTGEDSSPEEAGARLGPYKLLERIGEGGFGTVYMAEQEVPIRRRVAVKVLKPGMDSRAVIARFEAERQALALMDHPHIARVLDAGTTASGRPYFVMELVRGVAITKYCDEAHLSTAERLAVFLPVCHAVQHAHQKGIIHRDLKPSNVLVTLHDGKPVPKVIDFGIAKALEQRLTEKTLFTAFGQMIGTPAYMSPEQAEMSGLDIDTRSDVYSLGVLLYEILAGAPPFDPERLRDAGMVEILRIIKEEEPPRPSTKVSTLGEALPSVAAQRGIEPRKLGALLRGDLDWVVMKALSKERQRRYDSASSLAHDLERYLSHEPVSAGPPGWAYRASKFVRRNRVAVGAGALLALVLIGGMAGTTLGLVRARDAERAAKTNADDAHRKFEIAREGADLLLNGVVRELPNIPGTREMQRHILDAALKHYEKLAAEKPGDFGEQRRIWVAFQMLGDAYRVLGDPANARAAHEHFHALVGAAVAAHPTDRIFRIDSAISQERIGMQALDAGRVAEASAAFDAARRIYEELAQSDPQDDAVHLGLGFAYGWLGSAADLKGDIDAGIAWHKKAQAIWERRAAASPTAVEPRLLLVDSLVFQADVSGDAAALLERAARVAAEIEALGVETPATLHTRAFLKLRQAMRAPESDPEQARRHALASRELFERLVAFEPRDPRPRMWLIEVYGVLADVETFLSHPDEARAWTTRAHELAIRQRELDTESIGMRFEMARTVARLSDSAERVGDSTIACASLEHSRKLFAEILQAVPENQAYRLGAATVHMRLIRHATNLGELQRARESFEECERLCRNALEAVPDDTGYQYLRAMARMWVSETEVAAGNLALAEARAGEAVAEAESVVARLPDLGSARQALALCLERQGNCALRRNDLARAAALHRRVLEINEWLVARQPRELMNRFNRAITVTNLGDIAVGTGSAEEELRLRERALAEMREVVELEPSNLRFRSQLGLAALRFGDALQRAGDPEAALPRLSESFDALQPVLAARPDEALIRGWVADACEKLAQLHWARHDEAAAREWTVRLLAERRRAADAAQASVDAINSCAWSLLTCNPEDLRDAAAALTYARRVAERTQEAPYLDTLALAYFETGDVPRAVETQEKALERLGGQNAARRRSYEERLERYRSVRK